MIETTTNRNVGSFVGSILLIAGCCIGAGMISLPAITAAYGFIPSLIAILFSWAFMISSGMLLLEVILAFPEKTNLLTISHSILGKTGRNACGGLFLFLFFSLLIAYMSGTGILVVDFFSGLFHRSLPPVIGNVFCAVFLLFILLGGTVTIDKINRFFIFGMVISYVMLVVFGAKHIQIENLNRMDLGKEIAFSIPALLISFGYQNLLPSITSYLGKNRKKIQLAIILGCSIPLVTYLVWEMIILGMLNNESILLLKSGGEEEFIINFLQRTLSSSYVVIFIKLFSLFALLTSLLAVGLSCMDFLKDKRETFQFFRNEAFLSATVVLPPFIFSVLLPNLFLTGLGLAGGFGAVILFGLFPALMAGKMRKNPTNVIDPILPGGKFSLILIIVFSSMIFLFELLRQLQAF